MAMMVDRSLGEMSHGTQCQYFEPNLSYLGKVAACSIRMKILVDVGAGGIVW
jgi:hypothetical protein